MRCRVSRSVTYSAQGARMARVQAVRFKILRVFEGQVTEEVFVFAVSALSE